MRDPEHGRAGRLAFRSFRARILVFVLGLLVVVQGAVLLLVGRANVGEARRHVDEALALTAASFERSLAAREQILLEKARLLSADFAFKQAAATGERATVRSALENHQARVGATVMLLLALDGTVIADTLPPGAGPAGAPLRVILAAAAASELGEASAIERLAGRPQQVVAVPLFTPEPSHWIVIGFAVDDAFARGLQEETKSHVSLLRRPAGGAWTTLASTLDDRGRRALVAALARGPGAARGSRTMDVAGETFVTWVAPVGATAGGTTVAVLQRSLADALRPYLRLRSILVSLFALGLLLSLAGGMLVANRVTRPVAVLAAGARRIGEGDYGQPVAVAQRDEIGELARSFNHMMQGLAERDRVRDLLGKVVSPAIAEELLRKDIELGGEERTVSVLFSDIRDFAALAERTSPHSLVRLLNTYLTRVSAIVERHGGVVDKYVGDAVMALFGAPLQHADDARHAVEAALAMCASLDDINREIAAGGGAPVAFGVGINTGEVVAGNMGSRARLNYTVIGDAVNLASRLESLTKRYGVGVIVSASTRRACPGLVFRELDRVRVKGRREPVAIFEPVGREDALTPGEGAAVARYHEALARFRARRWDEAAALLEALAREQPHVRPYALYLERIARFRTAPPAPAWDGTVSYDEK